ncbi:MAG: outer membrane protein transport protein [Candidatus Aminicenantes bacterium]|nr:outer membrane protein transport protein [Candidatus Aminicenantes bacterium]
MSRKRVFALLAVSLLVLAPAARSSGFLIYEHGAAAMAMAGAFTSLAKDPSAIWHNPAGLAFLDGTRIMGGATFIVPSGSAVFPDYPGAPKYDQIHKLFYPPNLYVSHKVSDRVAVGIGVTSPFGLGIEWPEPASFPWRFLGTKSDMVTFNVNPTVAVKLSERFSLGAGVSFVFSKLTQSQVQLMPMGETLVEVPAEADVDGTAFAFNAGALYRGDGFRVGLSYRSRFTLDYSGSITLDVPVYETPFEGTGATSFRFPDIMTLGLSFDLTKKLVWAVDLHYFLWSVYDGYTFHIEVPDLALAEDIVVPTLWKDSWIARTGLEYLATGRLALRAGFAYDRTPQPAATMDSGLPDANRTTFTAGFGYTLGKVTLDFAYQYENFHERTSARPDIFQGTFDTRAHLFGVNLGYKF